MGSSRKNVDIQGFVMRLFLWIFKSEYAVFTSTYKKLALGLLLLALVIQACHKSEAVSPVLGEANRLIQISNFQGGTLHRQSQYTYDQNRLLSKIMRIKNMEQGFSETKFDFSYMGDTVLCKQYNRIQLYWQPFAKVLDIYEDGLIRSRELLNFDYNGTEPIQQFTYSYDAMGNLIRIREYEKRPDKLELHMVYEYTYQDEYLHRMAQFIRMHADEELTEFYRVESSYEQGRKTTDLIYSLTKFGSLEVSGKALYNYESELLDEVVYYVYSLDKDEFKLRSTTFHTYDGQGNLVTVDTRDASGKTIALRYSSFESGKTNLYTLSHPMLWTSDYAYPE